MQVGNTRMGKVGKTAVDAVDEPPSPPAPPKPPVRVSAKKSGVKPVYTVAARRAAVEGRIILLVRISDKGEVKSVKLIKGLGYGLDEAALKAVTRWTYSPATVDGKPVASTRRETVVFVLED